MADRIRVLILGTGKMGSGISRLVHDKRGLELVGAFARRPERGGQDLGTLIGLGQNIHIPISNDLAQIVEQTKPHVAIQATCSRLGDALGEITILLRHQVNVISIAEEMAYPACTSATIAQELDVLATEKGVVLLGTGVNPGFVLDLLVIALSGVCSQIQYIRAKRVNDLSPYGPTVLDAQGVGLTPDTFSQGLKSGKVAGHFGFRESIAMISNTLGWEIEHVEETREPIISRVRRTTPFVTVEPGWVAGCHHTAVAYCEGKPVITLVHPQQVHPHFEGIDTGDWIEIEGTPDLSLSGSPEIPGGMATTALAVNMIPRVLNAAPGLHSMADLPVPAAILGDARRLIGV